MPKTVAVIRDGVVVNTVLVADDWPGTRDPVERWVPPDGHETVPLSPARVAGIGHRWDGRRFTAPPSEPPGPPVDHGPPST